MGHSTKYYQDNPEARERKKKYDTKLNQRKEQVKKRVECNKKVREAKRNGKSTKNLDYDHAVNRFVAVAVNRGRRGEGNRVKKKR